VLAYGYGMMLKRESVKDHVARFKDEAAAIISMGFTATKMKTGLGPNADVKLCEAVASGVGDARFMVDANHCYTTSDAFYVGRALDEKLLQRSTFDLDLQGGMSPADVECWLLGAASKAVCANVLTEGFACSLAQAGLGVARLSLNMGTFIRSYVHGTILTVTGGWMGRKRNQLPLRSRASTARSWAYIWAPAPARCSSMALRAASASLRRQASMMARCCATISA
jgi:hypothetical protein